MKILIKNPLTIWLARLMQSKFMEYHYRRQHLKIGYLSKVEKCTFGRYNTIYDNVLLNSCSLGDFTYIASGTQVSKTVLGKYCSIGPDCKIGLGKHPAKDFVSTHPIFFSTLKQAQITFAEKNYFNEFAEINIGNDVWIGANTIILDGVKISDGVIIAAGSVVTKDMPAYAIVGGIPAKIMRYRFEINEINKLLEIEWWNADIENLKNNYKKFHNIKELLNDENNIFRSKE